MPIFTVTLQWTADVTVEAINMDEAMKAAYQVAEDGEVPLHNMLPNAVGVYKEED